MTTPNHIAGGLVFTGTMLSFYNVNLFAEPSYIACAVSFALLPDVDSPKTLTGRMVYPIAIFLNRRFGHRTFTHSLLFFFLCYILLTFLSKLFNFDIVFVKIFAFAFLSHLILDMLTIQGLPLFYPFRKNPCVVPSDPSFRLNTSNVKSELIVFTVFILLSFSMYPLFSQGFWTTYNRSWGTIEHCNRENYNSKYWLYCDYSIIKNNVKHSGSALIVESSASTLTLYNNNSVFTVSTDDKTLVIISTKPRLTSYPKEIKELQFMNVSLDSLTKILKNKVCTGMVQASKNVKYTDKSIEYTTNFFKLNNSYNALVTTFTDTSSVELLEKLNNVNARIKKDSINTVLQNQNYYKLKERRLTICEELKSLDKSDFYNINKLQTELIKVNENLTNYNIKVYKIDIVLQQELSNILTLTNQLKPIYFSGYISYLVFKNG